MSSYAMPSVTPQPIQVIDPYYGHEEEAIIAANYITRLFLTSNVVSPLDPPASPPLDRFIAYLIYRTEHPSSITFSALYLLHRLKSFYPAARGMSGHRLFLTAYMVASKMFSDINFSNKTCWLQISQDMFSLQEINQMVREMCRHLGFEFNIDPWALAEFENTLRRCFGKNVQPNGHMVQIPGYPLPTLSS